SRRHERRARLRLPFALEVQRAFAADLTRVGMPVAPPIYQAVDIRLLRATNRQFDQLEPLGESEAAFLVLSRDEHDGHKIVQKCVLTLPLVRRLKQMLEARLATIEDQLPADTGDEWQQQLLRQQREALRRAIDSNPDWTKLLDPIEMPTDTKPRSFVAGFIQIVRNKDVGDECAVKAIAAVSLQEGSG